MRLSYDELFNIANRLSKMIDESDGSFEAIKEAARKAEVWEDRHPARGAAELLVTARAQGWEAIANYLAYRSISERDPIRNILRPALRAAMLRDGIPRWVDRLARKYYEKPTPTAVSKQKVQDLIGRLDKEALPVADRSVVYVPTTWEGWDAFQKVHQMMAEISAHTDPEIQFDFSQCYFLSPVGVAVLGGVARSLEAEGRKVKFRWNSFVKTGVRENLKQNGFAALHGLMGAKPWEGNSVHYREDNRFEKRAMVEYLRDEWLTEDWIHLDDELRSALVGTVAEIYLNAFEHSQTKVGVFTCGQHYPNKGRLSLTVADFGVGIPGNVRRHLGEERLTGPDAMAWAFEPGNSTSHMEVGRGLGLELLREFVHVNKGSLQIYSGDGMAHLGTGLDRTLSGQPVFHELVETALSGTVVTIDIKCDDLLYVLEPDSQKPEASYFS